MAQGELCCFPPRAAQLCSRAAGWLGTYAANERRFIGGARRWSHPQTSRRRCRLPPAAAAVRQPVLVPAAGAGSKQLAPCLSPSATA